MKLGKYAKRSTRAAWHCLEKAIVTHQSFHASAPAMRRAAPKWHKGLKAFALAAGVMAGTGAQANRDCSEVTRSFPYMLGGEAIGTGIARYTDNSVCYGYKAEGKMAEAISPEKFCFDLKDVTPSSLNVVITLAGGAKFNTQPFPIEDAAMAAHMSLAKCRADTFQYARLKL